MTLAAYTDEDLLRELLRRNPSDAHAPAQPQDRDTIIHCIGIGNDHHADIRIWREAKAKL